MSFNNCCNKICNPCCKKKKSDILFLDNPKKDTWSSNDYKETVLFKQKVCLCEKSSILVTSSICAEIENILGVLNWYNSYKLYINDKIVCQAGYETEVFEPRTPRIETSSLTWAGVKCKNFEIVLTARLLSSNGEPQEFDSAESNVTNTGTFPTAKGAFLRIAILPKSSCIYFFENDKAEWAPNNSITLFNENICLASCPNKCKCNYVDRCSRGKNVMIFSSIAAEIEFAISSMGSAPYNTYKLIVDGKNTSVGGYESTLNTDAPNLETSSLVWAGKSSIPQMNIKVIADLTNGDLSNVNPQIKQFRQAKGACMSVVVIDKDISKSTFKCIPDKIRWTSNSGELILYDKVIKVKENILVDFSIAAYLNSVGQVVRENANIYRLYINDKQVSQAGYNAESSDENSIEGPNLETSSLIWGGTLWELYKCSKCYNTCNTKCCKNPSIRIKVTVELEGEDGISNVDNSIPQFEGSKGAFLSVLSYC